MLQHFQPPYRRNRGSRFPGALGRGGQRQRTLPVPTARCLIPLLLQQVWCKTGALPASYSLPIKAPDRSHWHDSVRATEQRCPDFITFSPFLPRVTPRSPLCTSKLPRGQCNLSMGCVRAPRIPRQNTHTWCKPGSHLTPAPSCHSIFLLLWSLYQNEVFISYFPGFFLSSIAILCSWTGKCINTD